VIASSLTLLARLLLEAGKIDPFVGGESKPSVPLEIGKEDELWFSVFEGGEVVLFIVFGMKNNERKLYI